MKLLSGDDFAKACIRLGEVMRESRINLDDFYKKTTKLNGEILNDTPADNEILNPDISTDNISNDLSRM